MARPRLVDVAREAGVSVGAASDALAGKNRIPEATRRRVRQAAEGMGYVPNAAARALGSGRLPILGLVVGGLRQPAEFERRGAGWADVIGAATLATTDRGYALAVLPGLVDTVIRSVPFAGLIIVDPGSGEADLGRGLSMGLPVLFGTAGDDPQPPAVPDEVLDDFIGAIEGREPSAARAAVNWRIQMPELRSGP